MAWVNQERKQKIVEKVKPILKKYNVKGTFSVRNHSTIVLTLKSGAVDFIGDLNGNRYGMNGLTESEKEKLRENYNLSINTYWCDEHYTGTSKQFLNELVPAMKSADWYDRSDIQTDYFDTAYYIDVNVGSWNKPYTLTK